MVKTKCSYCGKVRLTKLVQDQITVPDRDTEMDIREIIEKKTVKNTTPGFPRLCTECWLEISQMISTDKMAS